jgi:uncharacterized cupredoxin-like copper-binding protein
MREFIVALSILVALGGTAFADNRFHAVPAAGKADKGKLQVKVVKYDGSTNGELTVQVKNTGESAMRFSAKGLYFVPDGDPDKAPQRLGAVGPMQIAGDGEDDIQRKDTVMIAPGKTVELTLDVFCIDSHRASPSSSTAFTVGKKRMPRTLAVDIDRKAKVAADKAGGFAAPAAKSEVQSAVWATRDADWVPLEGESAQEAAK